MSAAAALLATGCSDGGVPLPSRDATVCMATGCAPDDAGAPTLDARTDACAVSGCVAGCVQGSHNVSRLVNGCEVWECCVPDDAGAPASDAQTARRNPECPASAPSDGKGCTASANVLCEYGGDEQGRCATLASCASSAWHLTKSAGCGNDALCPASFAAVTQGAACPDSLGSACEYPEATCGCTSCNSIDEHKLVWICGPWGSTDPACVLPGVRLGDACTTPNQTCWYGGRPCLGYSTRPSMACRDGYWGVAETSSATCTSAAVCL